MLNLEHRFFQILFARLISAVAGLDLTLQQLLLFVDEGLVLLRSTLYEQMVLELCKIHSLCWVDPY